MYERTVLVYCHNAVRKALQQLIKLALFAAELANSMVKLRAKVIERTGKFADLARNIFIKPYVKIALCHCLRGVVHAAYWVGNVLRTPNHHKQRHGYGYRGEHKHEHGHTPRCVGNEFKRTEHDHRAEYVSVVVEYWAAQRKGGAVLPHPKPVLLNVRAAFGGKYLLIQQPLRALRIGIKQAVHIKKRVSFRVKVKHRAGIGRQQLCRQPFKHVFIYFARHVFLGKLLRRIKRGVQLVQLYVRINILTQEHIAAQHNSRCNEHCDGQHYNKPAEKHAF